MVIKRGRRGKKERKGKERLGLYSSFPNGVDSNADQSELPCPVGRTERVHRPLTPPSIRIEKSLVSDPSKKRVNHTAFPSSDSRFNPCFSTRFRVW
jgi:hypothetical protein